MEVFSVGGSNTNGEVALVIAGIHGSELSGIEVARWLFDMLTERWNKQPSIKPYYTTVIIPEIYPESAKLARMHSKNPNGWLKDLQTTDPILWEKAKYNVDNVNWAIGREVILKGVDGTLRTIYTNRQFPPPEKPLSFLGQDGPTDATGREAIQAYHEDKKSKSSKPINTPMLPEAKQFLQWIEMLKPVRIVSIHAHRPVDPKLSIRGIDQPGIFVDPRYGYDQKVCGIDPVNESAEKFGTNLCKFDIIQDPAFPLVGFFELLNQRVAKNPPLNLEQKTAIQTARQTFGEFRKLNRAGTDAPGQRKLLDLTESQLKDAAKLLSIDYDKDYLKKKSFPSTKDKTSYVDDSLAYKIAEFIASKKPELVPGNWLAQKSLPPVVHYSASSRAPDGYSLGDWGPVTSGSPGGPEYRLGAPVITVEVFDYKESGAFDDQGVKQTRYIQERANELRIYAEALMTVFLEPLEP